MNTDIIVILISFGLASALILCICCIPASPATYLPDPESDEERDRRCEREAYTFAMMMTCVM